MIAKSEWTKGWDAGYEWAKTHWNGTAMELPEDFSLCSTPYWNGFDEGARCYRWDSKVTA